MLGHKERSQLELFVSGSLRSLLPDDHILVRVDGILDLSWLPETVRGLYCADNGRPSIAPEVAVRLMLAGFLLDVVHDRRYDLSRIETDRLETPFMLEPAHPGETCGEALARLGEMIPRILEPARL